MAALPHGMQFLVVLATSKSRLALATLGCSQGMVLGLVWVSLFFLTHLSSFSKSPFHVGTGSIARESQGDTGSWVGLEWDPCQPQSPWDVQAGAKIDRL